MTANPNDYDPNELRGTGNGPGRSGSGSSGGGGGGENRDRNRSRPDDPGGVFLGSGGGGNAGPSVPMGADEVVQSNQYRELFLLQQTTGDGGLERPYLETIPQSYAAEIVVFEWLEFLVDMVGFRRALDEIRYYRSIDWITDEVEASLREYLASFDDTGAAGELDRSDHLLSLVYVARLAAMD